MTSHSILVPLDGTAESNAALPLARTLALATGASIRLLRVLPYDTSPETREAPTNLQRIATELAGSGMTVQPVVHRGRAADEILRELQSEPSIDLIVMRTHGRAGVQRAILGSVTEHVLKQSRIPVVLMRPGQRRVTALHKVLVPVDGSPGGAVALGTAVGLARLTGATIKLVEVVVPVAIQAMIAYEYGGMSYFDPAWDEDALSGAGAYVNALVGRLRESGLTVEGEAFMAPAVAEAIVEMADKDEVDMVVMSTQALTGPARALLGSVADAVVRQAHCPVLLVHRTAETEELIGSEGPAAAVPV